MAGVKIKKRRLSRGFCFALIAFVGLLILGLRPPSAPELFDGSGSVEVTIVDHGWHTGLVIEQAALRRASITIGREDPAAASRLRWLSTRFPDAEWLEIGWGDSAVYQNTRRLEDLQVMAAVRALMIPTPSVLQIVPGSGDPAWAFNRSDRLVLKISAEGAEALARRLAETVPSEPSLLGPSLYGPGVFYNATPDYHLLRTCNHWISDLIRAAGVPSSLLIATMSGGLMAELPWKRLG